MVNPKSEPLADNWARTCGKYVQACHLPVRTASGFASFLTSPPGTFRAASPGMTFMLLSRALSLLLDLIRLGRWTDHAMDIEVLFLRQQLRILQRKLQTAPASCAGGN